MSTISTHLRNFKEPTKDQLTQLFFALPFDPPVVPGEKGVAENLEKMDINAVLSTQEDEESYVSGW